MLAFIGIISGLIYFLGDIPYILDTLKGKTKPHRVSWLIFFILDFIALINQLALGASQSLWLVASWTIVTGIVFALSIKKGVGGLEPLDLFCFSIMIIGLFLWFILKNPLAYLYCNLIITSVAFIPTIKKSYQSPKTETKISWLSASMGSLLGCISVGKLDFKLLLLPFFSFFWTFIIFLVLFVRSKKLKY